MLHVNKHGDCVTLVMTTDIKCPGFSVICQNLPLIENLLSAS